MATAAQIEANRQNAQLSTGAKTPEGKANSCMNNFRHGFAGKFRVQPHEKQTEFDALVEGLRTEHQPATLTEDMLVERMAEHYWLIRRSQVLQNALMEHHGPLSDAAPPLALLLRYQTSNERGFHKCLDQLLKLNGERRKARLDEAALSQRAEDSTNGLESQKRQEAAEERKQAEETRKQEKQQLWVRIAKARAERQELLNEKARSTSEQHSSPSHAPVTEPEKLKEAA